MTTEGADHGFDPYSAGSMNQEQIKKIIPHRPPFLLVDSIETLNETDAIGNRHVDKHHHVFQGHFPGNPVYPGVLILESLAQVLGVLILSKPAHRGKSGYFASMDKIRFRGLVLPGSDLKLSVKLLKEKKKFIVGACEARVDDKLICEAEMMLFLATTP